jgi:hypothetical protein
MYFAANSQSHQGVFLFHVSHRRPSKHIRFPMGPIRKNVIAAKCNCFRRIAFRKYLMKTRVLLLCLIQLWPLDAQNVAQPDIVTDRPDITESGVVVPRATLQIENGLTWTLDHGTQAVDLSESLIRFGILDRTEVRFGLPNYSDRIVGIRLGSGFGDLSFGVKQQLGPLPGDIDLSVIVAVSFPTGGSGVTSGDTTHSSRFPGQRNWSMAGQWGDSRAFSGRLRLAAAMAFGNQRSTWKGS